MKRTLLMLAVLCLAGSHLSADSITVSGLITQSTMSGTGPAISNPSLNNIQNLQPYTLMLQSSSTITGPGTYNLTGSSLSFMVPAAPSSENRFGAISLTILSNGSFLDFSLFACLQDASCFVGNSLSASFRIPVSGLSGTGVPAIGLDQPHPLQLLEDDGVTDLHGSITSYSAVSSVPEPSSLLLLAPVLLGVAGASQSRRFRSTFSKAS
jgi:hypothetical protein